MKILIINGPNINMLGIREPEIYGRETYDDMVEYIRAQVKTFNASRGTADLDGGSGVNTGGEPAADIVEKDEISCDFFQSNYEGEIVEVIQKALGAYDGIVINPAAYTHTSVAILDAIKAVGIPTVEVHISDPDTREGFRKTSFVREACIATVKGEGFPGYVKAIEILAGEK